MITYNIVALFWYKEIKNWLNYQDFKAIFVKRYKKKRTWRVFAEPVTYIISILYIYIYIYIYMYNIYIYNIYIYTVETQPSINGCVLVARKILRRS